jgi:hypothetical protein
MSPEEVQAKAPKIQTPPKFLEQGSYSDKGFKICPALTLRFLLTPAGMAFIKQANNKCWQGGGEEKESLYTVGGNGNLCGQYGGPSQN